MLQGLISGSALAIFNISFPHQPLTVIKFTDAIHSTLNKPCMKTNLGLVSKKDHFWRIVWLWITKLLGSFEGPFKQFFC
jgi:hypothetical protein